MLVVLLLRIITPPFRLRNGPGIYKSFTVLSGSPFGFSFSLLLYLLRDMGFSIFMTFLFKFRVESEISYELVC